VNAPGETAVVMDGELLYFFNRELSHFVLLILPPANRRRRCHPKGWQQRRYGYQLWGSRLLFSVVFTDGDDPDSTLPVKATSSASGGASCDTRAR
jgi:hypothetical protein